jgi:hypothetical protein
MKPKLRRTTKDQPVIGWELDLALDPNHEFVRLATKIPWNDLTQAFGRLYVPDLGRPGISHSVDGRASLAQAHLVGPEQPHWRD